MEIKIFKDFINESLENQTLVIIDIQPEVKKWLTFDLLDFGRYIQSFQNVYYIWNGEEMGYCNEDELKEWLEIHCGID